MTTEEPGPGEFPRPVGFSAALTHAWRLYRRSLRALFGLFLALSALGMAAEIAGGRLARELEGSPNLQVALGFFLPVIAWTTFMSVGVASAGPLLADRLVGRDSTFAAALSTARGSLRDVLAAGLFASIIALTVAAIFPPLWFLLLPLFLGPPVVAFAVSLESQKLQPALARGRVLVKGSFLRVLGILVMIAVGLTVLRESLSQIFFGVEGPLRIVGLIVSRAVGDAFMFPFLAAVSFIVYLDLRARLEDFDRPALIAERTAAHE